MPDALLPVLVNRKGGAAVAAGAKLTESIDQAFAACDVRVKVELLEGPQIARAVQAAKSQRVVVAGGDGTVACAAQALLGTNTELAILPLGTLNHLARDLGISATLEESATLAARGKPVAIDAGRVNGHCFVNNASIGVYPFMVRRREAYRKHNRWPKWFASIPAAWEALARLPRHRLTLDMGDGAQQITTPLLFVGNNIYTLEAGELGSRASLSEGVMSVYALVDKKNRLGLIWFAVRALLGRVDWAKDFATLGDCKSLTVRSSAVDVEIALDGELRRLNFPLQFEIMAGALQIVCPAGEAAPRE